MKITERFVYHGIRILAAVALLAVTSSPIRPTGASHSNPSPHHLPRRVVILNSAYCAESALSARPSLRDADRRQADIDDELEADIEDELTVTSPPASVSFDVLPTLRREPYSQRVRFAVSLAARPLRC
jgi:hypothetical protein